MAEEDYSNTFKQTVNFNHRLTEMYNIYSVRKEITVSKQEFLFLHDEILNSRNALSLLSFDIVLANNVFCKYDEEYFLVLKNDLNILMQLIIKYIKPIISDAYESILKYESVELSCREDNYILFDSRFLNNNFDDILGQLFRKNGILDELYYSLPEELIDEELTIKLYRLLSSHGLAFAYYANNLYEGSDSCFYGNNKTDQIFTELASRSSEDIFEFIKDIMKMPCQSYVGVVGGFIHLRKRYSHEYLTSFINHLKMPGEKNYIDPDWIYIYYGFLVDAEKIMQEIGDINNFDSSKNELEMYIREYENKKFKH